MNVQFPDYTHEYNYWLSGHIHRPVLYVLNIWLLDISSIWTRTIETEARKSHYNLDYLGNFDFYVGTI